LTDLARDEKFLESPGTHRKLVAVDVLGSFANTLSPLLSGINLECRLRKLLRAMPVAAIVRPDEYHQYEVVDTTDQVVWRDNENTMIDLHNDPIGGAIGPAQYDQWRARFGQTASNGAGADVNAPVPEPTSVALATG
jgi:hypothetical protein